MERVKHILIRHAREVFGILAPDLLFQKKDFDIWMDMNIFCELLSNESNTDVMLGCLFDLIYNLQLLEIIGSSWTNDMTRISIEEVMCALSWYLPLNSWSKIYIDGSSLHLWFTPSSSSIIVKHRSFGLICTGDILRLCCSHVEQIYTDQCRIHHRYSIANLKKKLKRQRDVAFGKIENSVPEIDKLKNKLFSWHYPIKPMSLLFMREMGEVHASHILIENVMRCEIGHRIDDLIQFIT